ncbi:hypothetical protein GLOIN_2v1874770 [Rhizophagus irregularis DAOM 181602=DAOM 197198]|nr:hypothetical protein GLOIN_2v1874770 [Rhizophagus irregularis DAOM 181602=DAOM 197198]
MSYSGQNKQLHVKEVHSNCLGVGYTVTIKRYTSYIGECNPELKKAMKNSISQYNNGYKKALELRQQYQQHQNYYIENVTTKSNTNAHYVISEQDQVLINASDLFLRRTPPLDVDSHTTMSDNSYISAAE